MTTTHTSQPMELLGAHPGISVIDPASVLTRLWYFDGKFLRAEGFRLDQQYVRSLVALSNQAVGHGIVHGFDVRRHGGATLRVDGGLGLAPSGRVVFLPSEVDLSVAELITRSSGDIDPGRAPSGEVADFAPCPPQVPGDEITTLASRPIYVLTAAATEALCGEEERFDKLCSDACGTDTDRSVAIEGVRFRVRQLSLSLPVSARVTFDERHLRSRVATAYFEQERRAVPSMISGGGLRSDVWCDGADGIGGDEIPLAVFEHTGSMVRWLDMWTARRELVETTPQRHWGWRLAMRPLDVALAQLLQFQCQVIDDPAGGGTGGDGPCAESAAVLSEADQVLASLLATEPGGDTATVLGELRARISGALSGQSIPASGSVLIDRGLVSLPPGGYLPVDQTHPVEAQVQALMGPGVDLRFCAVRPDFIPEALQEAQHMERISLTQGIDDPAALEEVDVLVPGGVVADRAADLDAFEGQIRLLPAQRQLNRKEVSGSVLSLRAFARDQVQEGWSWTLAAYGEAPHRLAPTDLMKIVGLVGGGEPTDDSASTPKVKLHVEADEVQDKVMGDPSFVQRANRESNYARERGERMLYDLGEAPDTVGTAATPDRPITPEERRPVSLWFDLEAGRDLREVPIGGTTSLRLHLAVYSRASTEPVLLDVQVSGSLVVRSKVESTSPGAGSRIFDIVTDLVGGADGLVVIGGDVEGPASVSIAGTSLRWRVGTTTAGVRILSVGVDRAGGDLTARFEDQGQPRHVHGELIRVAKGDVGVIDASMMAGSWGPAATYDRTVVLADLQLGESPGVLDPGSTGRALAEAVVTTIGTELLLRGRDGGFDALARRRLFAAGRHTGPSIEATADWVMFHRRRTKECAGAADRPTAVRRLRWFHTVVRDAADLKDFIALAGAEGAAGRVDQLGFEPVAVLEFGEDSTELVSSRVAARAAWAAAERGTQLLAGIVASPPTSDGAHVDLGWLMAAVSTVSDLVDTSAMRTSVIPQIPAEFRSSGIDGVIFTVGRDRDEVVHRNALLVRRSKEQFASMSEQLERLDIITPDVLDRVLEGGDRFVARFADAELLDAAEVATWWDRPGTIQFAAYGATELMRSVDGGDDLAAAWVEAISGVLEIPGLEALPQVTWELPDIHVVVFVVGRDD
ncbi:MAG: hypothetical protein JJE52_13150 [Acidimicrobiia bacterium]|nr:hypothetical protein [Acidimicrobiia bacterium]